MNNTPSRYTVELFDGTLEGTKVVSPNNMQFKAFYFRRDSWPTIKKRPDIGLQAIYFLLSFDSEKINRIYVGQTQEIIKRIDYHCHDHSKDWFEFCCLLTWCHLDPIDGNVLSRLEYMYINLLKKNKSYICENSQGKNSHSSATIENSAKECKADIDFLLEACGININQSAIPNSSEQILVFQIKKNGLNARMQYLPDEGRFIVLDGSEIDMRRTADSVTGDAFRRRMELFNGSNDIEVLGCDVDFCSASAASSFVIGNSSNGKVDWILEDDGKTPLKDFLS